MAARPGRRTTGTDDPDRPADDGARADRDLRPGDLILRLREIAEGRQAIADSFSIRREALQHKVTYSTTISGARALLHSLDWRGEGAVSSLQELHRGMNA